ncbi:uncharacterized protein LOC126789269 [Argentina anserina]|uniref:uncharacterized protein LOC126789269 n=1 Tax=Argentina anserina TaxID=57926 RepID=UPI0021768A3F|nr:uncharacterized protein LOC126789269 [Potentilla anserina]XP_050371350.1 uncharacterized protein LOC126789269 [Potentilla anserina]
MAIEKNSLKVSRLDSEVSPSSRKSASSDDDELQQRSSAAESDDEFDDADSGAGSDDFDLLELGETGVEYCQVGNQTCGIPFELYDLPSLEDILSVHVWNECLSEEEQFALAKYLPDMDQETFVFTMKELFTGCNFHFGSPVTKLFDMLKGGLCEPRVALYREGLDFFQHRLHYNLLRKHHNTMVRNLCRIRDAWLNCRGYSIEERLRVLNIMRIQKSFMSEKMEDMASDSSERDSGEGLRSNKIKDRKIAQHMSRHSPYGVGSDMDFASKGRAPSLEVAKYGKQNSKGIKLGGSKTPLVKEPASYPGPYSSAAVLPRSNKPGAYDSGAALRISGDDAEEATYGIDVQRDRFAPHSMLDNSGILKVGKNLIRGDGVTTDSLMGLPLSSKTEMQAYGRNRDGNLLPEAKELTAKPPNMRAPYDFGIRTKYSGNIQQYAVGDQMKFLKGRLPQAPFRGDRYDSSDQAHIFWNNRSEGELFATESPLRADDWSLRSKKWKPGMESPDVNNKSYRASPPQMNDRLLSSEFRAKPLQGKFRGNILHNGGSDMVTLKGNRMFPKNEDTESDTSDQFDEDEDSNPLLRSKLAYPSDIMEGSPSSLMMPNRAKYTQREMKNMQAFEGINYSKKMGGFVDQGNIRSLDNYPSKAKQKGKMGDSSPMQLEGRYVLDDDDELKPVYRLGKNAKFQGGPGERLHVPSLKTYTASRKQKREIVHDHSVSQSHYFVDEEDDSLQMRLLGDGRAEGRSRNKGQNVEAYLREHRESIEVPLLGGNSETRRRKGKEDAMAVSREDEDLLSNHLQRSAETNSLKKKIKRKMETETGSSDMEISDPPVAEMEATDMELEIKPQKKPFILITPTVHTGFSFSIMHLLSAVRVAMITPRSEDTLDVGEPIDEKNKSQEDGANGVTDKKVDANVSEHAAEGPTSFVTVQEIVNRVRSNPGDPCILETQEPLQDLVRGVLKIFSSKTAPLGVKGWKPLAAYERDTKSWSWTGPVSHNTSDNDTIEEVTSPEAWSLPHKMLVKLVDSFANWLKCGQETLQQLGSLPAPPLELMQPNVDEKDRFRDLRAQKSSSTITPSSDEVKAYFRKEELLRYSVPDRAFSYTAADGKKSFVAPLRRCGGKPTSKARDHFMLKRDRPPHVTILCLVRDAAARLPGSIGTRADVCTLIRDSQYIVEDVSDTQVNQIVSGALDRLHYERDPCVQFDGERKLWVYLHREREEEDFEDDGTSSTKKWKRPKKDAADQPELGGVTVAYNGSEEQSGYDLCSDLNADPSFLDDDKGMELEYDDLRQDADVDTNQGSEVDELRQENAMVWEEGLDLNPMRESKLLCQENSTNEDLDDETFGRERTVGLLSASLL